jgi:hypothetical protein
MRKELFPGIHIHKIPESDYDYEKYNDNEVFNAFCCKDIMIRK